MDRTLGPLILTRLVDVDMTLRRPKTPQDHILIVRLLDCGMYHSEILQDKRSETEYIRNDNSKYTCSYKRNSDSRQYLLHSASQTGPSFPPISVHLERVVKVHFAVHSDAFLDRAPAIVCP